MRHVVLIRERFFPSFLFSIGYRLSVHAARMCVCVCADACRSLYRLYSNRRSQRCKELLTLSYTMEKQLQQQFTLFAIIRISSSQHMMWWAENAIIMKFTRGKTHNVTIHIKPCCGGKRRQVPRERERGTRRKKHTPAKHDHPNRYTLCTCNMVFFCCALSFSILCAMCVCVCAWLPACAWHVMLKPFDVCLAPFFQM